MDKPCGARAKPCGALHRLIAEIDNALSTASTLTAAQLEEVTRLRDEGAALHEAGQHSQALATLNEARALLK